MIVLDTGAFVAVERQDRRTMAKLRLAADRATPLRTHAMIVAQVWRGDGARQAILARFLSSVEVLPVDEGLGRMAGELCGWARTNDPIDAALAVVTRPGDTVLTSDPDDISHLLAAAERLARVVAVT